MNNAAGKMLYLRMLHRWYGLMNLEQSTAEWTCNVTSSHTWVGEIRAVQFCHFLSLLPIIPHITKRDGFGPRFLQNHEMVFGIVHAQNQNEV